jgi:transcriptional regulator with XRE-family HTH domain
MALAERVGCSTTLIGNIETLKRYPSPDNMNAIAEALKVHPSELLAEESQAIDQMQNMAEMRGRLEQGIKRVIEEELS